VTDYPKPKRTDEEAVRRQVREVKEKRDKQRAGVDARRKIIYRNFKRKHRLQTPDATDTIT
jgi:hypothetical protein